MGLFSLEKAQVDLVNLYKYPKVFTQRESAKRTEPGSFQWCPVAGPEATGTK